MAVQLTDEQIAREIIDAIIGDLRLPTGWIAPDGWMASQITVVIAAALTRAREAGAEAMRERAENVADRHRARIPNHNPDDQSGDLVSHGYGNAALNISVEIRALTLTEVVADGK